MSVIDYYIPYNFNKDRTEEHIKKFGKYDGITDLKFNGRYHYCVKFELLEKVFNYKLEDIPKKYIINNGISIFVIMPTFFWSEIRKNQSIYFNEFEKRFTYGVYLGCNELTDDINLDFSEFHNLRALNLYKNKLTKCPKLSPYLEDLMLMNNNITEFPDDLQVTIKNLNIIGNKISHIGDLSKHTKLTHLSIEGNQLTSLPKMSNVCTLIAGNMDLGTIGELPLSIKRLDVYNTHLKYTEENPLDLGKYVNLTNINFNNYKPHNDGIREFSEENGDNENYISHIRKFPPNVKWIQMVNTYTTHIEKDALTSKQLEHIAFNYNNIKSLPDFSIRIPSDVSDSARKHHYAVAFVGVPLEEFPDFTKFDDDVQFVMFESKYNELKKYIEDNDVKISDKLFKNIRVIDDKIDDKD